MGFSEYLTQLKDMKGEDNEETLELHKMCESADTYLRSFSWVANIEEVKFGFGIGSIIAIFLFRVVLKNGTTEYLWVIEGDLPNAYLVTDQAKTPKQALIIYCDLMNDWINAIRNKASTENIFPVDAAPTKENADLLEKRVMFLQSKIIPTML